MTAFAFGNLVPSCRPAVMGVLNVTPDSFSDGRVHLDPERALARALEMFDEGAEIIDIGPESTRPGAPPVPAAEQIRRAIPVIERIRAAKPNVVLSLDTRLAEVAEAGLDAGVAIINDISALRDDAALAPLIARRGAGVVLMHMQGTPETMQSCPQYGDVVAEVSAFLAARAKWACAAGIAADRIAIDPGIGFGKTLAHNLALLRHLEQFKELGYPILLGASRKSFIHELDARAVSSEQRLGGSLACVARSVAAGVALVRVHDVRATRQLLEVLAAIDKT